MRPFFGVETEYAVTGLVDREGDTIDRDRLLGVMLAEAQRLWPHLSDGTRCGMFLPNGGRFYIDSGLHPEYATPECGDPWEAVRHVRAGDCLLRQLGEAARRRFPELVELAICRNNVDYHNRDASWGCHESYLHRTSREQLPAQLLPHLVSRIVYTGAGGFDPGAPGLDFVVSPRARHFDHTVSAGTVTARGIFNTRHEPLNGRGYGRLHVILGESLCSAHALALKVGVTALIVCAIDAGCRPGDGVQLVCPVAALQRFAGDPTCKATAVVASGRSMTAVQIQRRYLQEIEHCRASGQLPEWAGAIIRAWRDCLDRLERDPESLVGTLDWVMKRRLYENAARGVFSPTEIRRWSNTLARLLERLGRDDVELKLPTHPQSLFGSGRAARRNARRLLQWLDSRGQRWGGLLRFLEFRQQLLEIDTRFAQLGGTGIFDALVQSGTLRRRVAGPGDARQALETPPPRGRARIRGEWVLRLGSSRDPAICDWTGIRDKARLRYLNLEDPFAEAAEWTGPGGAEAQFDAFGIPLADSTA